MDPWSKVDYSRVIREASMAMEKLSELDPPSDRVPGQALLAEPILNGGGGIERRSGKGGIYRKKGEARRATRGPGGPLARPPPRERHQGAWAPGGGPLAPLCLFRKLRLCCFFI